VTLDQTTSAPGAVDADALTTTILTAVEKQLTRYFAAASQQTEAARHTAEAATAQLRADFEGLIPSVEAVLEAQRAEQLAAFEAYQGALQAALEERLSEFANHQHWRMVDIEEKMSTLEQRPTGIDPEQLIDLRQTVRDDVQHAMRTSVARLDELTNVTRRFDEQASALVQHVNDTTAALAQRMDEGDQRTAHSIEERIGAVQLGFAEAFEQSEARIADTATTLLGKLDAAETRATDKVLALEARINEEQGQKIANLEAQIGRVAGGFDDAMIAVSQRVLEAENNLAAVVDRIDALTETVSHIDQDALDDLKAQLSNAVGEAMLVRIELDRVVASTEQKLDKQSVRLGEIEALLTDEMDVGAAVQLERLDELERAIIALDPAQFVRKDEVARSSDAAGTVGPTTGDVPRVAMPSMTLNPRLPSADDNGRDGNHIEAGNTYSTF